MPSLSSHLVFHFSHCLPFWAHSSNVCAWQVLAARQEADAKSEAECQRSTQLMARAQAAEEGLQRLQQEVATAEASWQQLQQQVRRLCALITPVLGQ